MQTINTKETPESPSPINTFVGAAIFVFVVMFLVALATLILT